MSQFRHISHLFERMKKKIGFKWGYRAGVFAAACVYVGIREQGREIWIQDLMVSLLSPVLSDRRVDAESILQCPGLL